MQVHYITFSKTKSPPLLKKTADEVQVFIREQLAQREPYYSKAKHVLDVNLLDDYEKIKISVEQLRNMLCL